MAFWILQVAIDSQLITHTSNAKFMMPTFANGWNNTKYHLFTIDLFQSTTDLGYRQWDDHLVWFASVLF